MIDADVGDDVTWRPCSNSATTEVPAIVHLLYFLFVIDSDTDAGRNGLTTLSIRHLR